MPLTIPNSAAATTYPAQAAPDSGDFAAIVAGFSESGVISGLAVTANAVANQVAVAVGVASYNNVRKAYAGGVVTVTTGHATLPRLDAVVINGTTPAVRAGTAADATTSAFVAPTLTAGDVLLAYLYVPATTTTITSGMITDKRIILGESPARALGIRDMMEFGAAGTGLVDDSAAFAAALADIPTSQNGIIYFRPDKIFALNMTVNQQGIELRGGSMNPRSPSASAVIPWNASLPVLTIGDTSRTDTFSGVRLTTLDFNAEGPNGTGLYGLLIQNGSINQQHTNVAFRAFTTYAVKIFNATANGTVTQIWFNGLFIEGAATASAVTGGAQFDVFHTTGGTGYLTAIYVNNSHMVGNPWTNQHWLLRTDGCVLALGMTYFDMFTTRGIKMAQSGTVVPRLDCVGVQFDSPASTDTLMQTYANPTFLKLTDYINGFFHFDGILTSANGAVTLDATQMGNGNFGYGNMLDFATVTGSLYFSANGQPGANTRAYADSGGLNLLGNPGVLLSPSGGIVNTYVGGSATPDLKLTNDNGNFEIAGVIPATGMRYIELRVGGTAFRRFSTGTDLVYANTAAGSANVSSTTETAVLTGYSVAANELRVGQVIRIRAHGTYSTFSTAPTLIFRIKYGTNVLALSPTIQTIASIPAGSAWEVECDLVVTAIGASATVEAIGTVSIVNSTTTGAMQAYQIKPSTATTSAPVAFSSAAAGVLTVTAQWGTSNAANTLTGRELVIYSEN